MGTKKGKLNLTVAPEKKARAAKLAENDNRSVSSLFETLVDEAWEEQYGSRSPLDSVDGPAAPGHAPKKQIRYSKTKTKK